MQHSAPVKPSDGHSQHLSELEVVEIESGALPLELVKSSIELAERTNRPILEMFSTISSMIPPFKLVLTGFIGMWEIIHAIFLDKESSKLTRATKVGLTLGLIGVGLAAIAVAPLAGIFLLASAGIALGKELLNLTTAVSKYLSLKKAEKGISNPNLKAKMHGQLKESRHKIIEAAISVGLAILSVVGFALLITPLAPVGLGLLIGVATVGILVKVGPPLAKKIYNTYLKGPLSRLKARIFTYEGEKERESLGQKAPAHLKHEHETETEIMERLHITPTKRDPKARQALESKEISQEQQSTPIIKKPSLEENLQEKEEKESSESESETSNPPH